MSDTQEGQVTTEVVEQPKTLEQELQDNYNKSVEEPENTEEQEDALQEKEQEEVPEEVEEEDSEAEAEEAEEELDPIEAEAEELFGLIPKDWSEQEKTAFVELIESDDPKMKEAADVLLKRANDLKKGFFQKAEEFSKEMKPIKEVFAPYEQFMKQTGLTKEQYITNMIAYEQGLAKQPVPTFRDIAQKFKIDPRQVWPELFQSNNDDYDLDFDEDLTQKPKNDTNEVDLLKNELSTLRNQIANQPMLEQIRQFEEATDAEGKRLHPHFAEVKQLMGQLILQGKAEDLNTAYSMATRAIGLEEDKKTQNEPSSDLDEIRRKVSKAKKASKSVNTTGTKVDTSQMSIEDELRAKFNAS